MLINLRNGMLTGKRTPTAKDYVQSGLFAMYDALENVAYGQHDEAATSWNDLCGNLIAFSKRDYDLTFMRDRVYVNISKTGSSASNSVWRGALDVLKTGNFTIETVVSIDGALLDSGSQSANFTPFICYGNLSILDTSASDWALTTRGYSTVVGVNWHLPTSRRREYCQFGYPAGSKNGFLPGVNLATNLAAWTGVKTFCDSMTVSPAPEMAEEGMSEEIVSAISRVQRYESGSLKATANKVIAKVTSIINTYLYANTQIGNIRIYSRALTAAEIARNYRVDKARFNLP